jgi:hypothetical protein
MVAKCTPSLTIANDRVLKSEKFVQNNHFRGFFMREIDCAHSRNVKTNTFRKNEPFILQSGKNSFHPLSMRAIKILKNHKNHMFMKYKRLIFTKSIRFHALGMCAKGRSRARTALQPDLGSDERAVLAHQVQITGRVYVSIDL